MSTLKISHPLALNFLMTEDLYYLKNDEVQPATVITSTDETKVAEQVPEVSLPTIPVNKTIPQIIEIPKEPEITKPESIVFDYLGENNKYILILVKEPAHKVIGPKELETLTNILKGKKQEIKDVAIVNLNSYPSANYTNLKSYFACNSIIMFGVNPAQIEIQGIQANQISAYQGTKILATYSITEMLNSVDKKRAFWDEMKKL